MVLIKTKPKQTEKRNKQHCRGQNKIKENQIPNTSTTMTKVNICLATALWKSSSGNPETTALVDCLSFIDDNVIHENVHVMPRMNESVIHGLHTRGSKFLFCSLNWRYIWNTTILLRGESLIGKLRRSCTCRTRHCNEKA